MKNHYLYKYMIYIHIYIQ